MFIQQFVGAVVLFVLFLAVFFFVKIFYPIWRFMEAASTVIELYDIMMKFVQEEFEQQDEQIQVKHRRYLLAFSNTSEACMAYSALINYALKAYSKIGSSCDDPEITAKKIELERISKELKNRKKQLENGKDIRKEELKT